MCGFLNGYNTNNIMSAAVSRFKKSMDKAKAGYYCILFLLLGISLSTLVNTMYWLIKFKINYLKMKNAWLIIFDKMIAQVN